MSEEQQGALTEADKQAIKKSFLYRRPQPAVFFGAGMAISAGVLPTVVQIETVTGVGATYLAVMGLGLAALTGVLWALEGVRQSLEELQHRYPDEVGPKLVGGDQS